jgi:HTH-type transcriptional regulator, sugar sensing transcriptional regulator
MYEEIFREIGLTRSETSVYFSLLEIGSSTTGPIIKNAQIASGKAYIILEKLIEKGLVTYVIKSGTKHYQAKDPEQLLDYLEQKERKFKKNEEKIKEIIPKLKLKYESKKYKPIAEIYEGVSGFKTFYDSVLKELQKGDTIRLLGVPKEANERFQAYFIEWNKKRIKLGIKMQILYNNDSRKFGYKREKMKLTEVKYMKEELETPAWIDIFKDYVVTINVHGTPICFLIKNPESAESYKKYFDLLWKQAKP